MQFARTRWLRTVGLAAAGILALTACGGTDNNSGAEPTGGATTGGQQTGGETGMTGALAPADTCDTINVGTIGWTEDVAVNALWSHIMENAGYTWDRTNLEVGALYSGVANGDLDLFMDSWLPATHSDYWEQYGDQINDMTVWFDKAPLTWTVPSYVADEGITSIADLKGNADMFGGQIVGIESGAGLTRISKEEVIPTYGLGDEYELVESSTAAMLAALGNAIDDQEPIVVTLWQPHSAFAKWDLVNLEDPENALGDPDSIHIIAAQSFADDCPNAAAALSNFEISSEALADLELKIEKAGEGNADEGVTAWIQENQDLVDGWTNI